MAGNPDDPIPTRYSLLSRLKDREDSESWKDFFDTYWRLIYSVAIKAGLSEAEAQDAVQETIISVSKDIEKFKKEKALGSFKGWLRNLTRWRIADQLRKRESGIAAQTDPRGTDWKAVENIADSSNNGLDAVWEDEWRANLIEAALDRVRRKVKEEHFQIFDLVAIKDWPVTKAAKVLGVTTAQVYVVKHRLLNMVKKEMSRLENQR